MSEFVNRLYIDSRWRTANSASDSDFSVDLVESLACQSDTVAHIRAVSFPNSWWTCDGTRNKLALRLQLPERHLTIDTFVYLPNGYHTGPDFAVEMEAALNVAIENLILTDLPEWTVTYVSEENRIVAQFGKEAAPARIWQFLTEAELISLAKSNLWTGPVFNMSDPGLVDDVLVMANGSGGVNVNQGTWVSGSYDAGAGIDHIYIHSDLGRPLSNGPRPGIDRDVICRVPVTSSHGSVNQYEAYGHTYDFTQVYHASNKQISFRLTDVKGHVINFAGAGHVTIEILFYNHPGP